MMSKRKTTKKYYFSVEGETEKWYLEWLKNKINEVASCKVTMNIEIQKNPLKMAKKLAITEKTEIWHISDYESNEQIHVNQFRETIDNMKKAMNIGKKIQYKFGYSNFTFDLWIILHKIDCYRAFTHRRNYIHLLNQAYNESFENMDQYKHEDNFKRCLNILSIEDVKSAIKRAYAIMKNNILNGYSIQEYKGYKFYNENPSLELHKIIEKILKDCQLM